MLHIIINEIEMLCKNEIVIKENLLQPTHAILKNCYPKNWEDDKDYTSRLFYPQSWTKCMIYTTSDIPPEEQDISLCDCELDAQFDDTQLIFVGAARNTSNISLNPRYPKFADIEIIDFKSLLSEGKTFDFVIVDKTIPEAIEMIVADIADYGFEVGTIEINDTTTKIGAYNTQNRTAYDMFQYFAEISQAKWFARLSGQDKIAIDFYSIDKLPQKPNLEYNTEYFCDNKIDDISYRIASYDYRNRQIVVSNKVLSSIDNIETIYTNGFDVNFLTEQNIGEILSIKVNGQEKSFMLKDEKGLGYYADFYYDYDSNIIEARTIYQAGAEIQITYKSVIVGRQISEDNVEITRVTDDIDRNGIITRYEVRNDINDSTELQNVADTYLRYKGREQIKLKIKSRTNLFDIGDKVFFDITENFLKDNYIVTDKVIRSYNQYEHLFYEFELCNNYNEENELNYFDNQRRKVSGNIRKGETIIRNIDIEDIANIIFKELAIIEVTNLNNNILNCALNAPFME